MSAVKFLGGAETNTKLVWTAVSNTGGTGRGAPPPPSLYFFAINSFALASSGRSDAEPPHTCNNWA